MSRAPSPSAGRNYGLARVCRIWKVPASTVYFRRDKEQKDFESTPKRRGPKGACSDQELLEEIRKALKESLWKGEGYRKVWARLRFKGIRVSQKRVLRVMRENSLLAKDRPVPSGHSKEHNGTIIPDEPNKIWGRDATSTMTGEGNATIFFVLDHFSADCLGIHAARFGTRFEALVPFRQAIRTIFVDFKEGTANEEDLLLRHDNGSQFLSRAYQAEIRFLGFTSSPAYVREPETNGCAKRFVRTLKEQLLWIRKFHTIEELNQPSSSSCTITTTPGSSNVTATSPCPGLKNGSGEGGGRSMSFSGLVSKEPGAIKAQNSWKPTLAPRSSGAWLLHGEYLKEMKPLLQFF